MSYYDEVTAAADAIRLIVPAIPRIAVVLGSGLGELARRVGDSVSVPYRELPHWPPSAVLGHEGRLVAGTLRTRPILVLAGRCHAYEGHDPRAVTFGVRVLGMLGIRTLVLTNAAGGVNVAYSPGSLMAIDDHINLTGTSPLTGDEAAQFGPRFPDMTEVYSSRLRAIAQQAAAAGRVPLLHGVYAAMPGPSYETPAEIRYLRIIGVDAVGMSTVPEAIAARQMGIEVLGISCITNMAAGVRPGPLDHDAVLAAADRVSGPFIGLLEEILGRL